jgi:hypothetical protein
MGKGRVADLFNPHPRNHVDKVACRHDTIFFEVRWRRQAKVSDHRVRQVGVSLDGGKLLRGYFIWDITSVNDGDDNGIRHPRDCIARISFD